MTCVACNLYQGTLASDNDATEVYCSKFCCSLVYGEYEDLGLTAAKARKMLRDGKKLTARQRRYMGWVAGGSKKKRK